MGTTDGGFPFPDETDRPDVPADIQALAEAIDERVGDLAVHTQTVSMTFGNGVSTASAPINFPPGLFAGPPRVYLTVNNTATPFVGYCETPTATSVLGRIWAPTVQTTGLVRTVAVLAIGPKA